MTTAIDQPLSAQERRDYERLTKIVRTGVDAAFEAGAALEEIRERQLFKNEFPGITFETYCQEKWGMTRMRASQLITAATVFENVKNSLQDDTTPLPQIAAHAEAIAKVGDDPKDQAKAWEQAVNTAPKDDDGKPHVTAKHVASVVKEMKPPAKPKPRVRPKSTKPTQSEIQARAYKLLADLVMSFTEVTNAFGRFDKTKFSSKADLADAMKKLRLARKLTQEAANLL